MHSKSNSGPAPRWARPEHWDNGWPGFRHFARPSFPSSQRDVRRKCSRHQTFDPKSLIYGAPPVLLSESAPPETASHRPLSLHRPVSTRTALSQVRLAPRKSGPRLPPCPPASGSAHSRSAPLIPSIWRRPVSIPAGPGRAVRRVRRKCSNPGSGSVRRNQGGE